MLRHKRPIQLSPEPEWKERVQQSSKPPKLSRGLCVLQGSYTPDLRARTYGVVDGHKCDRSGVMQANKRSIASSYLILEVVH